MRFEKSRDELMELVFKKTAGTEIPCGPILGALELLLGLPTKRHSTKLQAAKRNGSSTGHRSSRRWPYDPLHLSNQPGSLKAVGSDLCDMERPTKY